MATSKKTAKQAGKDLSNKNTPKRDRGPIASALSQTGKKWTEIRESVTTLSRIPQLELHGVKMRAPGLSSPTCR